MGGESDCSYQAYNQLQLVPSNSLPLIKAGFHLSVNAG